jgi:uncharacterized protein YfaT (DUF1175 family)
VRASCLLGAGLLLIVLSAEAGFVRRHHLLLLLAESSNRAEADVRASAESAGNAPLPDRSWRDGLGEGFPDSARLDSAQDRENFTRWFTFLAETQYYAPTPRTRAEVQDCAALVRYAFRNALVEHTPAWLQEAGLPYDPGFGDVAKYHYPYWPLGRALFRATPDPAAADDGARGGFVEFADSATILRYNTYAISRDLRAARPGDLLFFHQPAQREPFHTMLFVGKSYYQPLGADWIVYHTGDMNGQRGEVREVRAGALLVHPDVRWRPLLSNPHFLGVYRLEILR